MLAQPFRKLAQPFIQGSHASEGRAAGRCRIEVCAKTQPVWLRDDPSAPHGKKYNRRWITNLACALSHY
jgi:hypothetical protein